ncbi:MAG: HNH endonuclease family protein [Acidothermaceae bacterium]
MVIAATSVPSRPTTTAAGTAPPSKTIVESSEAIAVLNTLAIKGRAPMTGYSRAQFGPAWPDISGCDERNLTLRRDLTAIAMRDSCIVASGTLVSPYTGGTISFVRGPNSAAVQIDHIVALGDAWQTGAQYWTATTREAFANDPIELLAVDAHSNEQKGDSDAASWLPAKKAFRCTYVSLQVDVKARYRLWVTQAEHDAIANILAGCAGGTIQTSTASTPTRSDVATPVAPAPTPPQTPTT